MKFLITIPAAILFIATTVITSTAFTDGPPPPIEDSYYLGSSIVTGRPSSHSYAANNTPYNYDEDTVLPPVEVVGTPATPFTMNPPPIGMSASAPAEDLNLNSLDVDANSVIERCRNQFVEFTDLLAESIQDGEKTATSEQALDAHMYGGRMSPQKPEDIANTSECVGFITGALSVTFTNPQTIISQKVQHCFTKFNLEPFLSESVDTYEKNEKIAAIQSLNIQPQQGDFVIHEERVFCTSVVKGIIFSEGANRFVSANPLNKNCRTDTCSATRPPPFGHQ